MPREARVTSSIGVYHTILRGVNKQQIFECTEDYEHFVRILQRQCSLPVDTYPRAIMVDEMWRCFRSFRMHLSFIFHLNPQYLMASDYMDYMDEGMTPPAGCENWIATFAQDAFDKVIKPHKSIANFILSKCYLKIS